MTQEERGAPKAIDIYALQRRIADVEAQRDEAAERARKLASGKTYRLARFILRAAAVPSKVAVGIAQRFNTMIGKQASRSRPTTPRLPSKAEERRRRLRIPDSMRPSERNIEEVVEAAAHVPASNGARLRPVHDLKVAIVTDTYMYNYYKDCFRETVYLDPEGYEDVLLAGDVDLFLYVTCWMGMKDGDWRTHVRNPPVRARLDEILELCDAQQIPTVFQSIEDPSNFDHFVELASHFRFIITSDSDSVPSYRERLGGRPVVYGEYGVNPIFNNPVGMHAARRWDVFFGGSYPRRYEQRCRDMNTIFGCISDSGLELTIADRTSYLTGKTRRQVAFPKVYAQNLIPLIPHDVLQRVHKCFSVNVNLNSITRSPTMCAMRVYELQAQGSLVLSNYALSVSSRFPLVDVVVEPKDIGYLVAPPHPLQIEAKRNAMVRDVISSRTAYANVSKWLAAFGLADAAMSPRIRVLVVLEDLAQGDVRQELAEDVHVEFAMSGKLEPASLEGFDLLAFMSSAHAYERHYLQDAVNAFKYVDCDFVTVAASFEGDGLVGPVHEFVDGYDDRALTVFSTKDADLDAILAAQSRAAGRGYGLPPFGVGYTRHLRQRSQALMPDRPVLSVIVPVYNNGFYLENRCLEALLTNRRFHEFEILLVDDGSTEAETAATLERLQQRYANVRVFRFDDGGSGSASRPRNKGLELATADLVTYLDPDNATSPGAYDALLAHRQRHPRVDAVLGYQVKLAENPAVIGRLFEADVKLIENPRTDFIESGDFPVISTQCAVIATDFLRRNHISYITGAVGQDTTFGYEILAHASNGVVFVRDAYLEYFSERGGSVTNTLDIGFFRKSAILEREQRRRFEKIGIWDAYLMRRAKRFVTNWYLPRLERISGDQRAEACELVSEILHINGLDEETYLRKAA